jgi:site-specific DNA-methyltransferase (adenine-specific)
LRPCGRNLIELGGGVLDIGADTDYLVLGDCAKVLPGLSDGAFQLVYIDPPFNTGKAQQRRTITTVRDEAGDRTGFAGRRYATTELARHAYLDVHDDYLGMLEPLLHEARRVLAVSGTLYLHIDYREAHYVKVLLDDVFGRDAFLNELIWAYDFGGRARDRWPAKHDTILVYVRTPGGHFFDQDAVERIPYLAPGLVGPEKAARGKLPTDVWWHTIVPTAGNEKTGYPNQKPEGILRRIVLASSRPGDRVLDFFAGSGTTGAVAHELGRRFVLVDNNPAAIQIMRNRLPEARQVNA